MNNADMLIHVHPDLDPKARSNLERSLEGRIGVDCAEFIHQPNPHTLMVRYDADVIGGMQLLDLVRKVDPTATRVGL